MHITKWLLVLALAAWGISSVHAQQKASPEQLQKALELLRQKTHSSTQPAPAPAPAPPSPKTPPASPAPEAKPAATPAPPPAPAQTAPSNVTSEGEKKARELLKASEVPETKPPAVPAPAQVQATPPSPPPAQETVKSPVPAVPAPATTSPGSLRLEQQRKALEVLRSIESSQGVSGASSKGVSEQEREAAIQRALDEAKRLAEQKKLQRAQDTKAAEERDLTNEISRVETQLLKAKQQFPSTNAILGSTAPAQPLAIPPPPPVPVTPAIPTTGSTPPSAPARPAMTEQQESRARALIEEVAPVKPATAPPAVTPDRKARERARKAAEAAAVPEKTKGASAPAAPSVAPGAASNKGAATSRTAPIAAGFKSKQERLAELLEAYRKDEITPQEYHQQRARILKEN